MRGLKGGCDVKESYFLGLFIGIICGIMLGMGIFGMVYYG
jgi:hypothetical protein